VNNWVQAQPASKVWKNILKTGSAGSERWKPDSRSGILPLARGWKPLPRFQTLEKELVCTK